MKPLSPKDPEQIGGFTLVGRLGAGGMGVVYLASRRSESVALKVVRESLIDDDVQATRFTREVSTLEKIKSPNVARIMEAGLDDGRAWFAAEFVNGPNLSELVNDKGPLDEDQWWELARGLLNGLADVHKTGVIHRDVKPANVIIAETGPKLIDFGIAHVSDATSVTATGLVAGSPAWFSPEQIEGLELTSATDVFSAGSVLTFAATGSSPWGGETTMTKASVFKILTSEPDLEGLNATQTQLLQSMLEKDPSRRPTAVSLMKNLDAIRSGADPKLPTSISISRKFSDATTTTKRAVLKDSVQESKQPGTTSGLTVAEHTQSDQHASGMMNEDTIEFRRQKLDQLLIDGRPFDPRNESAHRQTVQTKSSFEKFRGFFLIGLLLTALAVLFALLTSDYLQAIDGATSPAGGGSAELASIEPCSLDESPNLNENLLSARGSYGEYLEYKASLGLANHETLDLSTDLASRAAQLQLLMGATYDQFEIPHDEPRAAELVDDIRSAYSSLGAAWRNVEFFDVSNMVRPGLLVEVTESEDELAFLVSSSLEPDCGQPEPETLR